MTFCVFVKQMNSMGSHLIPNYVNAPTYIPFIVKENDKKVIPGVCVMQHNLIDYVGIGVWESKKIVLSVKNIAEGLCKPRSNQLIIYIVL